jgi:hypothetical protein
MRTCPNAFAKRTSASARARFALERIPSASSSLPAPVRGKSGTRGGV